MPEHLVICTICRDAVKTADKVGAMSYKAPEDPTEHGKLIFHPECCARVDGGRQTVTFHCCRDDDPNFKRLPIPYTPPQKLPKSRKKKCQQPAPAWICHACRQPPHKTNHDHAIFLPIVKFQRSKDEIKSSMKPATEILNDMSIRGRLYCVSRGKELVFAIDCYLFRVRFYLEGHALWVPTAMYRKIVEGQAVKRGDRSMAFPIPPELSDGPPGVPLKISIQAAFVRPDWALLFVDHNVMITFHVMALRRPCTREDLKPTSQLWPYLWSASHGPDFVIEPTQALHAVQKWRASSIAKKDKTPICLAIKETQQVFNGFGAQETCDMLFLAMIHPCMPVLEVCLSQEVWARLEAQLKTFHASRVTHVPKLPPCTSTRPFHMNQNGHNRFLALVLCYRRKLVNVDQGLLDALHSLNLLNSCAVIQPSGHAIPDQSLSPVPGIKAVPTNVRSKLVRLPNYRVVFLKGEKKVSVYTPIIAQPGRNWCNILNVSHVERDVKHELNKTTLGPYSFQLFVQAAWTMLKIGKSTTGQIPKGRRPTITTSNGRLKRPFASDIHSTTPPRKKKKLETKSKAPRRKGKRKTR